MVLPPDPATSSLSLDDIQTEYGGAVPIPIDEYYAGGPQVPAGTTGAFGPIPSSGEIEVKDFYGSQDVPPIFTITVPASNFTNYDLRSSAVTAGWNETSELVLQIPAGTYIYGTNTGAALTISGSFPGGVKVVNNGFIIGFGGEGARRSNSANGNAGANAINLGANVTIENNTYIAGGGGGGGGATIGGTGGGGAGGGLGGTQSPQTTGGTPGGTPGNVGSNGSTATGDGNPSGGGGGRVLPGTGGAGAAVRTTLGIGAGSGGGSGGGGGCDLVAGRTGGTQGGGGGGGGGWGATGGNGSVYSANASGAVFGGNGGSANNNGQSTTGTTSGQGVGGTGGKAVNLNGFVVTWTNTGTRYGAIS